jgi:predicted transcriptional regulator of viral defense system
VSNVTKIENKIYSMGKGSILFVDDFLNIASKQAIRVILSRLHKQGLIVRLGAGIYLYPKFNSLINDVVYPSVEDISNVIAKKEKARIAYTGVYALHLLGLSTQIPSNIVLYTDGSPRKVTLSDMRTITFKKTTARNLSFHNKTVMLVVSALRELGREGITDEHNQRIKAVLETVNKQLIIEDLKLAPEWIQNHIRIIMQGRLL